MTILARYIHSVARGPDDKNWTAGVRMISQSDSRI